MGKKKSRDLRDVDRTIRRLGGVGILRPKDLAALSEQKWKILNAMARSDWFTRKEIEDASGGAADAMRRMRELREFVRIARRRIGDSVNFEYSILGPRVKPKSAQKSLWDEENA